MEVNCTAHARLQVSEAFLLRSQRACHTALTPPMCLFKIGLLVLQHSLDVCICVRCFYLSPLSLCLCSPFFSCCCYATRTHISEIVTVSEKFPCRGRLFSYSVLVAICVRLASIIATPSSERHVVTRVVSQHMVKLHVVDLISSLGLEALLNDGVLLVGDSHFKVVKDGAEAREGNEARAALVLVLEVRLDEQATVLDVGAKAHQTGNQHLLLVVVQHVLGVKDGGRVELVGSYSRLLLQVFVCEDSIKVVTECRVIDEAAVGWQGEGSLQTLVLLWRQVDALSVQSSSKLLGG